MTQFLLLSNLGLGDNIFNISAINFLTENNEVTVVVKEHNYKLFKSFFVDNKNLDFLVIKAEEENKIFGDKTLMEYDNKKILRAACHKINSNLSTFPFCFYDDINLPREILKTYFKVRNTDKATLLYNLINEINYMFICNETSEGTIFNIDVMLNNLKINKHETLIVCSNQNIYNINDKFYSLAEKFVYKTNDINILDYKIIIENAKFNILSDSSLFTFALQLDIKNNNNFFLTRADWVDWNTLLNFYNNKFKLINKNTFKLPNQFKGQGQINMNSQLGNEIFKLSNRIDIRNIIEVGTYNGEGSTICVMNSIINKPNSILYSIEANKEMHERAVSFWNKYDTSNKLNLINGTLHRSIVSRNEVKEFYNTNHVMWEKEHYIPEQNFLETKLIDINNFKDVDIIILDGGEYTTKGDFNILKNFKPRFIVLDDSNVFKCKECRQILLNDPEYKIYSENLNDRNGWSIFIKKQ